MTSVEILEMLRKQVNVETKRIENSTTDEQERYFTGIRDGLNFAINMIIMREFDQKYENRG